MKCFVCGRWVKRVDKKAKAVLCHICATDPLAYAMFYNHGKKKKSPHNAVVLID